MASGVLTGWERNNETNLFVLKGISPSALEHRVQPRTRTIASHFAHIHSNRVYQMKKRGKAYLDDLVGFERGAEPKKAELVKVLEASGKAVGEMLAATETAGKVTSWHGSPASYLGYFTAHEAHHRAHIILAMRLAGEKLPKEITYGMWNWGKRGSL